MKRLQAVWILGGMAILWPAAVQAKTRYEALVIGNNRAMPPGERSEGGRAALPLLRFADDDAAAFDELVSSISDDAHLLTVIDGETQADYPLLGGVARPPTLMQVRLAVASLARTIARNQSQGDRTVVFIFFSGHGSVTDNGAPSLALLDSGITQEVLYDEILARLPAEYIHLFVDACHAEAVVRPRDTQAEVVRVSGREASAFLVRSTLARFPNVGAIVAAAADARSHEWDALGHGVFTYELLSALRGAADVNRDGRIEYSEVYAFLSAANRSVSDPRARLSIVARPPEMDRHASMWELSDFSRARTARLTGVPGAAGMIRIEDGAGRAVGSVHGEPGFLADLVVPAEQTIYVRVEQKEARFERSAGRAFAYGDLKFEAPKERARGALDDALKRGLFASEFGRHYYLGFTDQAAEFPSVVFRPDQGDEQVVSHPAPAVETSGSPRAWAWLPTTALAGAGVGTTVAQSLGWAEALRIGGRPDLSGLMATLDLSRGAATGLTEERVVASVGWLYARRMGIATARLGATVGGGAIVQTVDGRRAAWSGMLGAGPELGATVGLTRGFGLWAEIQFWGAALRRDGDAVLLAMPAAWIGVSLAP